MQQSLTKITRATSWHRRGASLVAALAGLVGAAPGAAASPVPPDGPRSERVVTLIPDDPLVVVMSDAEHVTPSVDGGARRAARSEPVRPRACRLVRVTVVSPDGRVETRVVAQRGRQPASSGD
jgi:hypothetical protein